MRNLAFPSDAGPETASLSCSDADFKVIAEIAYQHAGIVLHSHKRGLVVSRLTRMVRQSGLPDFRSYVALLKVDRCETARAIEALTTNHTKFFREQHHFAHLETTGLPALARALKPSDTVRIWSAGSSSGQEAYSIALTAVRAAEAIGHPLASKNIKILGTDINREVIETARQAQYPNEQLEEIGREFHKDHVIEKDSFFEFSQRIRNMTTFNRLNLMAHWPFKQQFDMIFCRNTMIYFDEMTKSELISRFHDSLKPHGFLYIGHSEQLVGPAERRFSPVGQTIYQRLA